MLLLLLLLSLLLLLVSVVGAQSWHCPIMLRQTMINHRKSICLLLVVFNMSPAVVIRHDCRFPAFFPQDAILSKHLEMAKAGAAAERASSSGVRGVQVKAGGFSCPDLHRSDVCDAV